VTFPGVSWHKFGTWQLVLPPNRPGLQQVRLIDRAIREVPRDARVAILGTTIEYLDLLYRRGFRQVACIERSPAFHDRLATLRVSPPFEELIVGDWLQVLPNMRGKFDLILSDFTLGNVHESRQADFLRHVGEALSPPGRFIDRVLTYGKPSLPYAAMAGLFEGRPMNLVTANEFNSRWLFCGPRVRDLHVVDTTATYDWTLDNFDLPSIRWLIQVCELVSPRGQVWYYGRPWEEVAKEYRQIFKPVAIYQEQRGSAYWGWAQLIDSVRA
jgi:SAM-dependent methyltransferase